MLANILEPRKENKQKRLKTSDLINVTIIKDFGWGPFHTNNNYYLIPVYWAFSLKTHGFERLLKVDQNKIATYCISVDGQKRLTMHQGENDDQTYCMPIFACVCSMCIDFNWHHNMQFYRFWMCLCVQSKTHQK